MKALMILIFIVICWRWVCPTLALNSNQAWILLGIGLIALVVKNKYTRNRKDDTNERKRK